MGKTSSRAVSGIMVLLVLLGLLSPLVKAEELITNPLDELLPSRDESPINPLVEPEWYYGISWSETLSEPGFVEGKAVSYYKRFFAHSDMSVEFYVYRFLNVSSAEAYLNKMMNQTKSEGGYTEVSISVAFAVVYDYDTQEIGFSWGVIGNIVFKVVVYTDHIVEDPTDTLVSFTLLEHERILEMAFWESSGLSDEEEAPSNPTNPQIPNPQPPEIIPEFPSVLALLIPMIFVTLIAIIMKKKMSKRVIHAYF